MSEINLQRLGNLYYLARLAPVGADMHEQAKLNFEELKAALTPPKPNKPVVEPIVEEKKDGNA